MKKTNPQITQMAQIERRRVRKYRPNKTSDVWWRIS